MARLDYLTNLLDVYDHDPRCSTQFASGYRAVLSRLNASSSLTSRRYPIWPLVRANLDGPFDQCLAGYKGDWAKSLLIGARLSEMAHIPPPFYAAPYVARPEIDGSGLTADVLARDLIPARPENMPEIDWQLQNLDRWDSNIRVAIRSLLSPNGAPFEGAESLCGALESIRDLFRLMRHFRPLRTKALRDFDAAIDDRTRPQDGGYCELCWRVSIRSSRLDELAAQQRYEVGEIVRSGQCQLSAEEQEARMAQAWMLESSLQLSPSCTLISKAEAAKLRLVFERFRVERIVAGNLSSRHCHVHKPGSAKYHADLRYKPAFQRHLSALSRLGRSEFAFNFLPPSSPDIQEIRKVAYDQVHAGLHVVTIGKPSSLGLREKVWLMHEEGISQSEMARRLGISRQAISKAKKSLELLMNTHHAGSYINPLTGEAQVPEPIRKAIRDAVVKGLSITVIAKEVGLSKGTVDGLIRLMGNSK
ncbi:helix-turn-helix domain-containing protein [Pseudomonas sp. MWU16-30316]|uniref:MarR family transcriptional regulator n=1 Tax=Pseudomonas sp. MWU16-30316 TaxID=2878093 RepID=UPI001CF8B63E|nr:helix-turn-helix domain-containing protein [Pseudomonas sp. MWU16-30316]